MMPLATTTMRTIDALDTLLELHALLRHGEGDAYLVSTQRMRAVSWLSAWSHAAVSDRTPDMSRDAANVAQQLVFALEDDIPMMTAGLLGADRFRSLVSTLRLFADALEAPKYSARVFVGVAS